MNEAFPFFIYLFPPPRRDTYSQSAASPLSPDFAARRSVFAARCVVCDSRFSIYFFFTLYCCSCSNKLVLSVEVLRMCAIKKFCFLFLRARCVPAQLRVASSWSRSGVPRLCVDTLTGLHLSQVAVLSAFRSYSILLLYGGLCGRIFGRVIRSFALPLRSQASATRRGCTWTTGPTASNGTPGSASTV